MKNLRKSLLLILALVALGQTARAQNVVHVSNETDLRTAIQNQGAGTIIIVEQDISITNSDLVFNKGFILDLNGRILSSETINGSVSKAINATPGVYMLCLINGENVKVQKIVVR